MEEIQNEEMEPVTINQVAIKWGLYLGLIMIIYGLALNLLDLMENQALNYVNYAFIIALMYFAHKAYKDEGNGYMAYGQGLGLGTMIVAIGGLMSTIFSYIYVKFIDPSFMERMMDMQMAQMQEKGLSDEQIDQAMEMSARFMTPEILFPIGFVVMVFVGFIIALIVSAITKNPDPSTEI